MIKALRHIVLLLILVGMGPIAHAQFVAFRLEIPAGVKFSGQILDPLAGGTWENSKGKVWIKLEAPENLSLLLDLEFPEREVLPPPAAYFLNDGSADFERASLLKPGSNELQMISPPKLMRNVNPRPSSIQAWLGLPVLSGIRIKIEYP